MKAEYFPPKVDIILQNEIPTDLYILVSGAVVYHLSLSHSLSLSLSLSLSRFLAFSFYAISYTKSEIVSETAGHADIQEWNGAGMLEQLYIK